MVRFLYLSGALLGVCTLTGCGQLPGSVPTSSEVVATVDGVAITQGAVDAYGLVFVDPRGNQTVSRDVLLLSLTNQTLVIGEANRVGITVSEADVDAAVEAAAATGLIKNGLDREGGVEQFRKRLRTHSIFQQVKELVAADVTVTADEVKEYFNTHAVAYEGATPEDVRFEIERRILRGKTDEVWTKWLEDLRACADIVIVSSLYAPPAESATCAQ